MHVHLNGICTHNSSLEGAMKLKFAPFCSPWLLLRYTVAWYTIVLCILFCRSQIPPPPPPPPQVYLTAVENSDNPSMQWHMDFSTCGLVVHRLEVKVRCGGEENMGGVNFTVRGDDTVYCSPLLGGEGVMV